MWSLALAPCWAFALGTKTDDLGMARTIIPSAFLFAEVGFASKTFSGGLGVASVATNNTSRF